MPRSFPIDTGIAIRSSESDLLDFRWRAKGITADFVIPGDAVHALRVSFDRACIVRILDEMPLSTEEYDTPNEGLVPEHFAYRVEGAQFARMQSEAWKEVNKPVSHYLFVTGWGCLDVVSSGQPTFSLVDRSENSHRRNDELGSGA